MPMSARTLSYSLQQSLAGRQPAPVTVAPAARSAVAPAAPNPASAQMPDRPLRLTDDQLAAVLRAAEPLAVGDRGAFLQDVAAALQGREVGDGMVYRVVAQAQRRYFDPPIIGLEAPSLIPLPGAEPMTRTALTAATLTALALPAAAQPTPQPKTGGACPSGYTESGGFCAPMRRDAPVAILKLPGKQCPSGYAIEASYCVEMRRR